MTPKSTVSPHLFLDTDTSVQLSTEYIQTSKLILYITCLLNPPPPKTPALCPVILPVKDHHPPRCPPRDLGTLQFLPLAFHRVSHQVLGALLSTGSVTKSWGSYCNSCLSLSTGSATKSWGPYFTFLVLLLLSYVSGLNHFFPTLQWVKVAQSCPTLRSPPGSSVHGILQARTLEWGAVPFSRASSQPRDWTWASCIAGRFFTIWALGKPSPYRKLSHNESVWWHNFPSKSWSLIPPHSSCKKDPGSLLIYKCSYSLPLPADISHPHVQCQELELKNATRCLGRAAVTVAFTTVMLLLGDRKQSPGLHPDRRGDYAHKVGILSTATPQANLPISTLALREHWPLSSEIIHCFHTRLQPKSAIPRWTTETANQDKWLGFSQHLNCSGIKRWEEERWKEIYQLVEII